MKFFYFTAALWLITGCGYILDKKGESTSTSIAQSKEVGASVTPCHIRIQSSQPISIGDCWIERRWSYSARHKVTLYKDTTMSGLIIKCKNSKIALYDKFDKTGMEFNDNQFSGVFENSKKDSLVFLIKEVNSSNQFGGPDAQRTIGELTVLPIM